MTTDDDENAARLVVLGDDASSSSSSSDSSDSAVAVKNPTRTNVVNAVNAVVATSRTDVSVPTNEAQQVTVTNPVIAALVTKQKNSIAHEDWVGHRSLIFHVDLEHGGDACGVLQLSVVAYDPTGFKVISELDEHIKPLATALWPDHASEVHGLYPTDERIRSAMSIFKVWNRFVLFIEGHLHDGSKKGMIAASCRFYIRQRS